jgi:hypothetical protein
MKARGVTGAAVGALIALALLAPLVPSACAITDPSASTVDAFDLPPGGEHVDPGVVDCVFDGGCRLATGECCQGPGADGGAVCLTDGSTTCPASTGAIKCDETADCPYGQRCCATPPQDDAGFLSTQCAAACSSSQVQLCRTNGECPSDICHIEKCPDGVVYEMCDLYTAASFPCTTVPILPDGGRQL